MKKKKRNVYKIVGLDTFSHEEYPIGVRYSLDCAKEIANNKGGPMNVIYVIHKGQIVYRAGTY